jgi:hypothetical protein
VTVSPAPPIHLSGAVPQGKTTLPDEPLAFEHCPGCGHKLGAPAYVVVFVAPDGPGALPVCPACASVMQQDAETRPRLFGLLDAAAISRHDVWPMRGARTLASEAAAAQPQAFTGSHRLWQPLLGSG